MKTTLVRFLGVLLKKKPEPTIFAFDRQKPAKMSFDCSLKACPNT